MRLTIDSFAWIEVIRGSRIGSDVRSRVDSAESVFTPGIALAEVALRCLRDGLGEEHTNRLLQAICQASRVVPITPKIALAGARAAIEMRERNRWHGQSPPGLADGLVLATARVTGSQVLTGDCHFQGIGETAWLQ